MKRIEAALNIQAHLNPSEWKKKAAIHYKNLDERWQAAAFQQKTKVGEHLYKSYQRIAQKWLGAEIKVVNLKDGPVTYWQTRKPGRDTVLFLHGFGDTKEGAYPLSFFLNSHFNVIAVDLPGFGESFRRPDLSHNLDAFGRWLEEFIDAIEMGPVHVAGNSLGGAMALKLALTRPEIVKSLILLNNAGIVDLEHRSIYDELLEGKSPFSVHTMEDFDAFLLQVFHKPPQIPPFLKEYVFHQMRQNNSWLEYLVKQNFENFKDRESPEYQAIFMNDKLDTLNVPTLIIWGDRDHVLPLAYGKEGQRLLKNSQFVILEDVGHAPQVEAPSKVAKLMKDFISGLNQTDNLSNARQNSGNLKSS
jgi:abhydrolase domain-containing protein 6